MNTSTRVFIKRLSKCCIFFKFRTKKSLDDCSEKQEAQGQIKDTVFKSAIVCDL